MNFVLVIHISDCRQFSDIHISQGSVEICLGRGGIVKFDFVANLPVSLSVKEFWKSVNIWGSYGQEFGVLFFVETQCTHKHTLYVQVNKEWPEDDCTLVYLYKKFWNVPKTLNFFVPRVWGTAFPGHRWICHCQLTCTNLLTTSNFCSTRPSSRLNPHCATFP